MKIATLYLIAIIVLTNSLSVHSENTNEKRQLLDNLIQLKNRIEEARTTNSPTGISIDPASVGNLDMFIGMSKNQLVEAFGDSCTTFEGELICNWSFFWKPPEYLGGGYHLIAFFDKNELCTKVYTGASQ